MKIIVVTENCAKYNNEVNKPLNIQDPVMLMKADSTLLKDGKPLFIPDSSKQCSAALHLVARISRLGKSIPRRFASRYYDALTVGIDVQMDNRVKELKTAGLPWDVAENFDGSAIIGEFVDIQSLGSYVHEGKLQVDEAEVAVNTSNEWKWGVDELIERLSQENMLRQGDLLFLGSTSGRFPLQIGQHFHAELDGRAVLDFNVR